MGEIVRMMRIIRHSTIAGVALFLLLSFFSTGHVQASAHDKTYSATRFDVTAHIQTNNTMQVTETEVFHFSGGTFSSVVRNLPTDNTDDVTVLEAGMDGQSMSEGTTTGHYEIKSGNPIMITWHFQAAAESTHTFTLTYQMQGIVQKQAQEDLIDWKPLPTEHPYTITSSTITIDYPSTASLRSTPEIDQGEAAISQAPGEVIYKASDIEDDAGIELGLRFQPGLAASAPQWQLAAARNKAMLPFALPIGLIIALIGSFLVVRRYRGFRRSTPSMLQLTALGFVAPPTNLPPAIAGVLATTNDGGASWNQALATIFSLMDRGVIAIAPPSAGGWLLGSTDFNLVLLNAPPDLLPHEAVLIGMLFQRSGNIAPLVGITQAGKAYQSRSRLFNDALRTELITMGIFDAHRQSVRQRLGISTVIVFVLAILFTILMPLIGYWSLIFIPLAFVITSITAFIVQQSISTYSEEAYQLTLPWRSFAAFLNLLCKGQGTLGAENFATYMAYATAFGQLADWARTLQSYGIIALPHWFRELVTAGYIHDHHGAMNEFRRMSEVSRRAGESSSSSNSGSGDSSMSGSSGAAGGGSSSAS